VVTRERAAVGAEISRDVLRPTVLLGIYLLVLSAVLPVGVSHAFVQTAVIALAVFAAVVTLISLWMTWRSDRGPARSSRPHVKQGDRAYRADVWLLLVPLAPIVRYIALNDDSLSWSESLRLTLIAAGLAGFLIVLLPYFVQRWMSATIVKMLGLSLAFTLFSMPMLSRTYSWHKVGDPVVQLSVFAVVLAVGVVLYRRGRAGAYLTAAVYFLAVTMVLPLLQTSSSEPNGTFSVNVSESGTAADAYAALAAQEMALRPDIFLLTYDSYVGNETMLQHGIDNSEQEANLESLGFRIYPGTYSVAANTVRSMGRVLGSTTPWDGIAGDSPLLDAISASGYHINGTFVSAYPFRASDPSYDSYFPAVSAADLELLQGILQGEFTFDLAFQSPTHEYFVTQKRAVMQSDLRTPLFMYTHTGPWHAQFSGACLENEVQQFEDRLVMANAEMRDDVETILKHRPNAVIIINGDHGPYLTKNCTQLSQNDFDPEEITRLDIQDRFGTFLAVKWPYGEPTDLPKVEILQDVLPAVVSRLYEDVDYDALRFPQRLAEGEMEVIAGLGIERGRIVGGPLDGESLFLGADGGD
jgi:hypothetical protein